MRTVVFRGPGDFHAFTHLVLGYWEFVRDVPQSAPGPVVDYVMSLNPWNATLDNAADYGAKLFEIVEGGE